MGKRFTETNKWETPHYRGLSLIAKVVLAYLHDRCDVAGVWEPDFGLAEFCIGNGPIDFDPVITELGDRIRRLQCGKFWLTRHVRLQCGQLKPTVPPHKTVIRLLQEHGISLSDPWIVGDNPPEDPPPSEPVIPIIPPNAGALAQLYAAQGTDALRATVREKDNILKALKMIIAAEPTVTPDQIAGAAANYRKKYPKAPCTAKALADHWSELAPAQRSGQEIERAAQRSEELARLRKELDPFIHKPFGVPVGRPDLTDEQIDHARDLNERIEALEKQL